MLTIKLTPKGNVYIKNIKKEEIFEILHAIVENLYHDPHEQEESQEETNQEEDENYANFVSWLRDQHSVKGDVDLSCNKIKDSYEAFKGELENYINDKAYSEDCQEKEEENTPLELNSMEDFINWLENIVNHKEKEEEKEEEEEENLDTPINILHELVDLRCKALNNKVSTLSEKILNTPADKLTPEELLQVLLTKIKASSVISLMAKMAAEESMLKYN